MADARTCEVRAILVLLNMEP